jgi:amidophosphoribosyltransferase
MGIALAETILAQLSPPELAKLDVVIPVPETSNTCAIAAARHLKKPLSLGLARNRYVHRTFIMPGESQRKKAVSQKLNAIKEEFAGRNVLLIDDSIVRGTTSKEVIRMARSAGAKKVYFASCSPPIR